MRIFLNTNQKRNLIIVLIILAVFFMAGAFIYLRFFHNKSDNFISPEIDKSALNDVKLSDNQNLYNDDSLYKVWSVYITVYTGTDETSGGVYDLEDLNSISATSPDPKLDAVVKILDPKTDQYVLGADASKINCTISQRGQSARKAKQKSYKVNIFDSAGSFQGQQILNLNKHFVDKSRLSQKFCFDMISIFPDMISLRTTFFVVYIKDGTAENSEYVNYGLFTHIEQPNETFLSAHGLDRNGTLYKPTDFEFHENDAIVSEDDPKFDLEQFSDLLKIRENPDNAKLKKMLDDVNNTNLNFNDVFKKYFDKDNYLTWCAMNLLLNNYDTMSRNYLLYSPSYSDKWYFLPWDYDASLFDFDTFEETHFAPYFGISRYWGTVLHNRFFKDPDNVKLLDEKIEKLYNIMMTQDIDTKCEKYLSSVLYGFSGSVDEQNNKTNIDTITNSIKDYKNRITLYHDLYYSTKEKPMPVFLGTPVQNDNSISFNWSPSYDLQADRLYYVFYISTDVTNLDATHIYDSETSLTVFNYEKILQDGTYYWGVKILDGNGNSQIPFDRIKTINSSGNSVYYFGVKQFEIKDGKLVS